jgi:hypothetical protein
VETMMRPSEGVVGLDPLAARLADGDPRAARVQTEVAKDREWRAYLGAGGDPSLFDEWWTSRHEELIREKMAENRRDLYDIRAL